MEAGDFLAVVHNSQHAGLSVTLMPNTWFRESRKKSETENGPIKVPQTTVETNTDRITEDISFNVKYASSYQISSCLGSSFAHSSAFSRQMSTFYRDSFAESLRKYPIVTSSADFIRKILNHTQMKHRKRRSFKSIRHFVKSKNQQTHKMIRCDRGVNSTEEQYSNTGRSLSHFFSPVRKRCSSQVELLNYTYDYLKSDSLVPNIDVRYLTEVKRAICGRLKEIIEGKPKICPHLKYRYVHHKRYGKCSKPAQEIDTSKLDDVTLRKSVSSNMVLVDSLLKRKSCFCIKPSICDCKTKTKKYHPEQNILPTVYPRLQEGKKINEMNLETVAPGDFKISDNDDYSISVVIKEWMKELPVYPSFSDNDKLKQEQLVNNLAVTLTNLQNQPDFISKAKSETVKCLKALPMWRPSDKGNATEFLDNIANKLIARLTNQAESHFKNTINLEIKKLPFQNNSVNDSDIEEITEIFIRKLKPITLAVGREVDGEIYKDALKFEIIDLLRDLPLTVHTTEAINKLASDIALKLYNIPLYLTKKFNNVLDTDYLDGNIFNWFKTIPEFNNKDIGQYGELVNLLTKNLHAYASQDVNRESIKNNLQEDIKEWLYAISSRMQISFSPKRRNELCQELMTRLIFTINRTKNKLSQNGMGNIFESVMEWYLSIPGLSKLEKNENKKDLETLVKKLIEIRSRNDNFQKILSDIKYAIDEWLQDLFKKLNLPLDTKVQDNLVNKLILEMKDVSKRRSSNKGNYDDLYNNVLTWLKNIPNIGSDITMIANEIVEDFVTRLKDPQSRNVPRKTEVEDATKSFLDLLSKKIGCNIDIKHKKMLEQHLFDHFKLLPTPRRRWNDQKFLHQPIHLDRSTDENGSEYTSSDPKVQTEYLGPQLNENRNNTNEDDLIKEYKTSSIEEYYSDSSNILRNISKVSENFLNNKLNYSRVSEQREKVIEGEEVIQETLTTTRRFTTSTPLQSINHFSSLITKSSDKELDHKKHLKQLKDCIYDWINKNDVSINKIEKQNLVDDIATEYLERQKYIQLSGTKSTESDELEYLKYQIYRRLLKSKNIEELPAVMRNVSKLNENLKTIKVADFIKQPFNKTREEVNIYNENKGNKDLIQKITSWLQFITTSLYNLHSDKNYEQNLVHELATTLLDGKKRSDYDNVVNKEILQWLPKVLNTLNKNNLTALLESLKSYINDDVNETHIPMYDTSQFVIENFTGAILDWLKESKPFSKSVMRNIQLLDDFSNELAIDLKKVFDDNASLSNDNMEKLLVQEVIKKVKVVLGSKERISNLPANIARNLIKYLKDLRLFHDISQRIPVEMQLQCNTTEDGYLDKVRKAVIIWAKELSLEPGKTFEDINSIVDDFIDALSTYIFKDINTIENRLSEDIIRLLKVIPLKIHQIRFNELKEYTKELINSIKDNIKGIEFNLDIPNEIQDVPPNVENIIKNWCENLPIYLGQWQEKKEIVESIRQQIESQITNAFNKLYTENNDFESLLRDEINKIIKIIPMSAELEKCLDLLTNMLVEKLKKTKDDSLKEQMDSNYRLLLHETINKTLSLIENPSIAKQISFKLLKEKLADSFINLHYFTNDAELRSKFKNKLVQEINKFCTDYLKTSHISAKQPKQIQDDLDKALKNVSVPKIETTEPIDIFGTIDDNNETIPKIDASVQCSLNIPPSILSIDDRNHLQKIKDRSHMRTQSHPKLIKDVSLSPIPIDNTTQTERYKIEEGIQTSSSIGKPNLKDMSPQVIIKEFYWDSNESNQSLEIILPQVISQNTESQIMTKSKALTEHATQTLEYPQTEPNPSLERTQLSRTVAEDKFKRRTGTPRTEAIVKNTADVSQQTSNIASNQLELIQKETQNVPKLYIDKFKRRTGTSRTEAIVKNTADVSQQTSIIASNQLELIQKETQNVPKLYIPSGTEEKQTRDYKSLELDNDTVDDVNDVELIKKKPTRKGISGDKFFPDDQQYKPRFCTLEDMSRYKENTNCSCRNRMLSKCKNKTYFGCRYPNLKHCGKCYGGFCPHPSNLFFRREF